MPAQWLRPLLVSTRPYRYVVPPSRRWYTRGPKSSGYTYRSFWTFNRVLLAVYASIAVPIVVYIEDPWLLGFQEFESFELVAKEAVSTNSSIFHFTAPKKRSFRKGNISVLEGCQNAWQASVFNVEFKQPQLQILRAYTPLPPDLNPNIGSKGDIAFFIRNEEQGEVSKWLHSLPIGSEIEIRGPNKEYEFVPLTRRIIFIAGGTGIATALQAANAMLNTGKGRDPSISEEHQQQRKVHIMWASRRKEDCAGGISDIPFESSVSQSAKESSAIVAEIDRLKMRFPGQITVDYFVDEDGKFITENSISKAAKNLGSGTRLESLVFVSGPEGFINYVTGEKTWNDGRQDQSPVQNPVQSPVSGIVTKALSQAGSKAMVIKV